MANDVSQEWLNYRNVIGPCRQIPSGLEPPTEVVVSLEGAERTGLEALSRRVRLLTGEVPGSHKFAKVLEESASDQDFRRLREVLKRKLEQGFGFVVVDGLPLSPDHPESSALVTVFLGCLAGGQVYNFRQEGFGSGPIVDNIHPSRDHQYVKGAGGYTDNFPFHTESAWHPLSPHVVVITCLRGDPQAQTLVFSATQAEELDLETRDVLSRKDLFRLHPPDLYIDMQAQGIALGTKPWVNRAPVDLSRKRKLNLNFNGTTCASTNAVGALHRLEEFIHQRHFTLTLAKGSALILNNDISCHTRTGYLPKFDGDDRWLQRSYFLRPVEDQWGTDRVIDIRSRADDLPLILGDDDSLLRYLEGADQDGWDAYHYMLVEHDWPRGRVI